MREEYDIKALNPRKNPYVKAAKKPITMRDATKEELEGVDRHIKSISKSTGIDFFALC